MEVARGFGQALARRGWVLVYGGGRVGLMGALADGALSAGGKVIGVIPQGLLQRELAHRALTQLEVVGDMAARKTRMIELSDAFVALPGGLGTLDELFEVLTLAQIGEHSDEAGCIAEPGRLLGSPARRLSCDGRSRLRASARHRYDGRRRADRGGARSARRGGLLAACRAGVAVLPRQASKTSHGDGIRPGSGCGYRGASAGAAAARRGIAPAPRAAGPPTPCRRRSRRRPAALLGRRRAPRGGERERPLLQPSRNAAQSSWTCMRANSW